MMMKEMETIMQMNLTGFLGFKIPFFLLLIFVIISYVDKKIILLDAN